MSSWTVGETAGMKRKSCPLELVGLEGSFGPAHYRRYTCQVHMTASLSGMAVDVLEGWEAAHLR